MSTLNLPVPDAPGAAYTLLAVFAFASMAAVVVLYAFVLLGWDAEDRAPAPTFQQEGR